MFFLLQLCEFLGFIIPLLIAIAILTLLERKLMGLIQRRRGPNVVGFFGLLQPIADGLKLVLKETILPIKADFSVFIGSPIIVIFMSFLNWVYIPWFPFHSYTNFKFSILLFFGVS